MKGIPSTKRFVEISKRINGLTINTVNKPYRNTTLTLARAAAITVCALSVPLLINGCSLLSPQAAPPPPPPAIISTSKDQVDELEKEVKQKDLQIDALTRQLASSKEQVAELKEQKEFNAPTSAVPDSGNASPVSTADSSDDGTTTTTTVTSSDDTGDTSNPENITVWVSTSSNQYFLPGSRFYGKGQGQYMSEDQATNDGYKRSAHR